MLFSQCSGGDKLFALLADDSGLSDMPTHSLDKAMVVWRVG
jgi:hypothetical protein